MHPVKNPVITTGFKYKSKRKPSPWVAGYHPGIDYRASIGTPTYAPADGFIVDTSYDSSYGYKVVGQSKVGNRTLRWWVAHHRKATKNKPGVVVKKGQKVKQGDLIGYSGDTGNTFGAHVHFEVREAPYGYWDHIDPKAIINVKGGPVSTDKMDPAAYFIGAKGSHVKWLGERLVLHGFGKHYKQGPGPTFTEADRLNVRDAQLFLGFRGGDADGFPGKQTLAFLAAAPDVDLPPDTEGPVLDDDLTPLQVLARWAWTDTKNGRADRPLTKSKVTSFTLHYPGDGDTKQYAALSQNEIAALLEGYRKHHVENKGWADIGYNYAIDGSGRTWFLTGDVIGAHSEDENDDSIGVLLVLGNKEQPTARMIEAFKVLRDEKRQTFTKATKVLGHQQQPGEQTACPGQPVMKAIEQGLFTEAPLPVPEPEPEPDDEPAPPKPVPITVAKGRTLNINVCADYCSSTYSKRIAKIEAVRDKARASIVFTTESGSYADAEKLNKKFGWGGKRNGTVETGESFVLHGGSVPITTAVHFNPNDYDVLDEGLWVTEPGTTHRWATWVLLRERESRQLFIVAVTHLQYKPKGPNTIRKYDKERERQLDALLDHVEALQRKVIKSRPTLDVVPAIVPGDMNGKRTDDYDGPGRAAKAHGYIDAAEVGTNSKAIIDRTFVQDVEIIEHAVLATNGATDHETAFAAYVSLTNNKE